MRYREQAGRMLDKRQVMILSAALVAAVHRHVTDPKVLDAVARDLEDILNRDTNGAYQRGASG